MTWTIWINFLPLSHRGFTWNLASIGTVVLVKIFEHTHARIYNIRTYIYTYIHTLTREHSALNKLYIYSCTPERLRVIPDGKIWVVEGGGGGQGHGRGASMQNTIFLWRLAGLFFFCFFFLIHWAVGFCENVSFSAGGGLSQKFISVGILCSNGIFWREYTVLYPGKTRLKPWLF